MSLPSEDDDSGDTVETGSTADVVVHAERLLLSRERVAVERVRFTKRIVTTTRTVVVPVRVEQLVVSHEPFPEGTVVDEGAALDTSGPGASATATGGSNPGDVDTDGLVILLHEEVPEFTVRVQPVERVTIGVRAVAEEDVVTAVLRSETVEVDVAGAAGRLAEQPGTD